MDKWIPVEDRLPELDKDEGYIVSVNGRLGNVIFENAILLADYFGPEYGWSIEGWEDEDLTVAAWMPLPEPYKDGAE